MHFLNYANLILTQVCLIFFILLLIKKYVGDKYILLFGLFLIAAGINDLITYPLAMMKINNLWVYHFYYPIQYAIISYMFISWLPKRRQKPLFIPAILFFIYLLIDHFILTDFYSFSNYATTLQAVLLLGLSAYFLVWFLKSGPNDTFTNPQFWISAGMTIFFTFSSLSYLLFNYFHMRLPFVIHSAASILAYSFYFYALLCYYRIRKMILS